MAKFDIDVTNKIERLDALEERLNVSLSGLSAYCETFEHTTIIYLRVLGEFQLIDGFELKERILIRGIVYDSDGRVINTNYNCFDPDSFYGTQVLDLSFSLPSSDFSKIQIYPQLNR